MMSKTISKTYFHYITLECEILSWVKEELTQLAEEKNIRRKQTDKANQIQTYVI